MQVRINDIIIIVNIVIEHVDENAYFVFASNRLHYCLV